MVSGEPHSTPLTIGVDSVVSPEGTPIDVHVPDQPGPWPVVILLHGAPPATKEDVGVIAESIARRGAVVFNVAWFEGSAEGPYPCTYLGDNTDLEVWLTHGDEDTTIPPSVAEDFRRALEASGYRANLVMLEGASHDIRDPSHVDEVLSMIESAIAG